MRPLLPQHDPDTDGRRRDLEDRRTDYTYDPTILPPFVLFHQLPREELFTLRHFTDRLASSADLPANLVAVKLRSLFDRFDDLGDYDDLFALLPRPAVADRWRDDATFAEQRVAGTETRMVRRLDALPDPLRIDPARLAALLGEPPARALAEGRLFLADYALLDGIPAGATDGRAKFLYAPLALLHRPHGAPALAPVAIQLDQRPRPGNLFTREDGDAWLLAKTAAQAADYTLSMMAHHVQRVHLGRLAKGIFQQRHTADQVGVGLVDARGRRQEADKAARAVDVYLLCARVLAHADDGHLGQPAFELAVKIGVRLDAIDEQRGIGGRGVGILVERRAVGQPADLFDLHGCQDL
ncbi:MAG TPA: hypothetical protein PKW35_10765, partial [Nannocystaceae bacterium]|nr:hypothetical protein [Nannocystaceae bacterium]